MHMISTKYKMHMWLAKPDEFSDLCFMLVKFSKQKSLSLALTVVSRTYKKKKNTKLQKPTTLYNILHNPPCNLSYLLSYFRPQPIVHSGDKK